MRFASISLLTLLNYLYADEANEEVKKLSTFAEQAQTRQTFSF
jgi:hypothetical protein